MLPAPLIVLGSYAMPQFVRLNILWCRRNWPEAVIYVVDDFSPRSDEITDLALSMGAVFTGSATRRSHSMGDVQAFVCGAGLGRDTGHWVLKLSQRFIPLQGFREALEASVTDPVHAGCVAFMPGRIRGEKLVRPGLPYQAFGHLTDCVLFDPAVITPEIIIEAHQRGYGGERKALYAELVWARILEQRKSAPLEWLANASRPFKYLRKASCHAHDYKLAAEAVGISGDWDTREWRHIEGKRYLCTPTTS